MSTAISQTETKSIAVSHYGDSLASGLSFMLIANVVQRGIGFIRNLVLCRFLIDEQMGQWALASSFFVLAAPLAVLGLPGTFGRFVESYRASGHLATFLRHVATVSGVGTLVFSIWLVLAPTTSSLIIFGVEQSAFTMLIMAFTLCAVICFNTVTELMNSLRKSRTVSSMHTCNSIVFTLTSLTAVLLWKDWRMLVASFGISAIAGILPAVPVFRAWHTLIPKSDQRVQHRLMWQRLLPFALSIWCMNLLANMFDVVDRYMLLYLAGQTIEQGQAIVGQFHSGRILPVLLSSLASMLCGILLPYLVLEWESGRKDRVARSLELTLKCSSLFFMGLSVAALAIAPFLFEQVLQGRYSDGLSIMPQAMLYCCLAAMAALLQNYFLCAERGKSIGIMIAIGLVVNVLLNLWWVPMFGLHGAMIATSICGGLILVMTLLELNRSGIRLPASVWVFAALPVSLLTGTIGASFALAAILMLVGRTQWFFTNDEKLEVDRAISPRLAKLGLPVSSLWPRHNP